MSGAVDITDRATEAEEQQRGDALAATLRRSRARDAAPGGDGDCADCGTAIDPRRLEAVPNATRCIGCVERAERES